MNPSSMWWLAAPGYRNGGENHLSRRFPHQIVWYSSFFCAPAVCREERKAPQIEWSASAGENEVREEYFHSRKNKFHLGREVWPLRAEQREILSFIILTQACLRKGWRRWSNPRGHEIRFVDAKWRAPTRFARTGAENYKAGKFRLGTRCTYHVGQKPLSVWRRQKSFGISQML